MDILSVLEIAHPFDMVVEAAPADGIGWWAWPYGVEAINPALLEKEKEPEPPQPKTFAHAAVGKLGAFAGDAPAWFITPETYRFVAVGQLTAFGGECVAKFDSERRRRQRKDEAWWLGVEALGPRF